MYLWWYNASDQEEYSLLFIHVFFRQSVDFRKKKLPQAFFE